MTPTPLTAAPLPEDADRWLAILARLDLDALTEEFLAQIRTIEEYRQPPIPFAQVRIDAVESFDQLIQSLSTGELARTVPIATRVGVTRARAGVPLTALMTAIRLDFTVLWRALLAVGDADDTGLLLRHATVVWEIVDNYVRQTQHAYLLEERRMAEEEASVRRGYMVEILDERPVAEPRLQTLADELALDVHGTYLVAAGFEDAVAALRVVIANLERDGHTVLTMYRGDGLVLAVPCTCGAAKSTLSELAIGLVDEVPGLATVAEAGLLAARLATLRERTDAGALTPFAGWTRLVRQELDSPALGVAFSFDRALEACGAAERAHLEAAVRSFLRTGNITASAAELFCHRNTMTNRLHRFAALTGIDVTVPEQAARVVVAWS